MMNRPVTTLPIALALLLAACSAPQERAPEPAPRPVESAPPVAADPVDQLLARAARGSALETAGLRLDAATRLIARGDTARALEAITPISTAGLPPLQFARRAWVQARADLAAGNPRGALGRLEDPAVDAAAGSDRTLQVDVSRTRAEALLATGHYARSARERAALQPWLSTDGDRDTNARSLLDALARISLGELDVAAGTATSEDWRAWLELAMTLRDIRRSPGAQRARLQQWQASHVGLAAMETATRTLLPEIDSRIANPSRVALLLPLSGRAGSSGHAVLQGYLAEHYQQARGGDRPPPVAVIDTAAEPGGFAKAYQRAAADGATLVVGPLLKEELAAFSAGQSVLVPTLALNFLDEDLDRNASLHLFGIDLGDEIEQLVATARHSGHERLMILGDGSERARRYTTALQREWTAAGGATLGVLELGDLNEFRTSLEQSLLLEQSSARAKVLEQVLGVPLTAELRRRADLDLVILLADPAATHSIRSLLTYLYAGDVAVWGTSLGGTGMDSRAANSDLEGLRFLDMPWFAPREAELHAVMDGTLPPGPMSRLVALGVDAARLQSRLAVFEWLPGAGLAGASGDISRDSRGRLRRTSEWYRVTNGLAAPERAGLPASAPDSTEGNSTWTEPTTGLATPVPSAGMQSSAR